MTDNNVTIEYTELDALRAELETARVEASDLAGQLRDVRTDRDQWWNAYAERSQKVAELQMECDALHRKLSVVQNDRDGWREMADAHTRRGDEYLSKATKLDKVLSDIQAMAADDLRQGIGVDHGNLWQIEADARAALAGSPAPTRGGGSEGKTK